MIIKNKGTSGPTGQVLYLAPSTKMHKFHLVLLVLNFLTHSFSHPHWELSAWSRDPKGEWEASGFGFQGIHSWGWDTDVSGEHYMVTVAKVQR